MVTHSLLVLVCIYRYVCDLLYMASVPAAAARCMQAVNFTFAATITSLSGNTGSLAGGALLTLNVGGAGLPLGFNESAVSVTIGKQACPLVPGASTTSQVVCLAPAVPAQGMVYAEYWVLPIAYNPVALVLDTFGPPSEWWADGLGWVDGPQALTCLLLVHNASYHGHDE